MDNNLTQHQSWWKRNWKWFVPVSFTGTIIAIYLLILNGNITDFAKVYADAPLYENALEKAKQNPRVTEVLGTLEPIDQLAVMEGNAVYSNNNNAVALTLRVKGSKGNGRMDILADKNGAVWEYKTIKIRIKNPKEEIVVLKDSL